MLRRAIIVCADDFGLAPGVSEAILGLMEAGRINATSCMTRRPVWRAAAPALRGLKPRASIGLHLEISAGSTLKRLHDDVARQFDAFEDALGTAPDFVDGHRHVHLRGSVAAAVIRELRVRGLVGSTWVRSTHEPLAQIFRRGVAPAKAALLSVASRRLIVLLRRERIDTNDSFRGVYGFGSRVDYRRAFRHWLAGPGERPLMMCHPGEVDPALRDADPVVEARTVELAYLRGDEYLADIALAGLSLSVDGNRPWTIPDATRVGNPIRPADRETAAAGVGRSSCRTVPL